MHKEYFLIIFISSYLFSSCTKSVTDDKIVISGSIAGQQHSSIYLYGFDTDVDRYINNKSVTDSSKVEKDGSFYFKTKWHKPGFFDLRSG